MMAGDNDGLQGLSIRMDTAERRVDTIKSTLDLMTQELKKLPLKINYQSLDDGTHRRGRDHPSTNLLPLPPFVHPPQQPPPYQPHSHHPPPRYIYNILNLMNFSAKRNCAILSINIMILKMIMNMKGWSMKGKGDL